jgi:hypothetical protein
MLKKLDWLIIILVAVFGLTFSFLNIKKTDVNSKKILNVYIEGKLEKSFSFSKEFYKIYTINSKFGYNILEINNGVANFTDADCKEKLCVRSIGIGEVGDFIICLPHKLVIQIEGESEIDAISY